jgi:hypothetical protein
MVREVMTTGSVAGRDSRLPRAIVPSWQDRHSFDGPDG